MVSHGTFAPGLHNALGMMVGAERTDILSTSMLDGMSADTFRKNFTKLIEAVCPEDEILLLADIIGGSPLSTAMDVLGQKGLLENTVAIGGMNLPLALGAAMADADVPLNEVADEIISEAAEQLKPFLVGNDSDDEI